MNLHCILVSDGSSDKALIPIIDWVLRENGLSRLPIFKWADPGFLPRRALDLADRMTGAVGLFDPEPCDLLIVHRDAERESREKRVAEIREALEESGIHVPVVPVVPVRMLEAWLLADETALRSAAGNPSGQMELELPAIERLERLPDPKETLDHILRTASGRSKRRQERMHLPTARSRITSLIDDFAILRGLPAFAAFEEEAASVIRSRGWSSP